MSNEKRHGLISTALSVLQPLALSWVAVVILAVLSYVFAASSPMLGDAPWQDAARLGTSIWLLALGAPLGIDGGTVGLMPLVVTVCIWLLCRYFLRSAPVFDWVDVGVAAATAGITAGLLGLFSMPDSFRLVGVLGAMLIVAVSALASWWRHEPPEHRVWSALRECWPMMWPMLAGIVLAALVGVVVAVVLGWSTIVEINSYYVLGTLGTISLSFVQALYLPNLVVWAMAYISGVGFAVGSGSSFFERFCHCRATSGIAGVGRAAATGLVLSLAHCDPDCAGTSHRIVACEELCDAASARNLWRGNGSTFHACDGGNGCPCQRWHRTGSYV